MIKGYPTSSQDGISSFKTIGIITARTFTLLPVRGVLLIFVTGCAMLSICYGIECV